MGEDSFSDLMTSLDAPLIVLTTTAEGQRAGCLVGFHAQSSIAPEHYCVWLSKANHTYRVGLRAQYFAVHFLTSTDLGLAEAFGTRSGADVDKFSGLELDDDQTGVPLLRACRHRLVLERIAILDDGGDHVCLTTRVLRAMTEGPFAPLRLSAASHLEPGRSSEERAVHADPVKDLDAG